MAFRVLSIDNFGGGHSDSDFGGRINEFKLVRNFDIDKDQKILTPEFPMTIDTGLNAYTSQILGYYASYGADLYQSANSGYLLKRSGTAPYTWATAVVNSAITSGKLTEYKNNLHWGTNIYYPDTGAVSANALTGATNITYKHAPSDELYFASTNSIHSYDGTTFTPVVTTTPLGTTIQGMTAWENYMLIGASDTKENDSSRIFLWDTYSLNPEGLVDIGDTYLKVIKNVNGVVILITAPNDVNFYEWRGGNRVYLTKKIKTGLDTHRDIRITEPVVKNGKLYVGISNSKTFEQGIYSYKPHPTSVSSAVLHLDRVTTPANTDSYTTQINHIHIHDALISRMYATYNFNDGVDDYKVANVSDSSRGGGVLETINYEPFTGQQSRINRVSLQTKPLPSSASLSAWVRTDSDTTVNDYQYIGSMHGLKEVKKDFYDMNGSAFNLGNYHQFKIKTTSNAQLLKLEVKFQDVQNR